MCVCVAKNVQQLVAKSPSIPRHTHIRICSQESSVHLLSTGPGHVYGEVVFVSLTSQNLLQFGPEVRKEHQEKQRAQMSPAPEAITRTPAVVLTHTLQPVEVLRKGGTGAKQEVVLKQEVEDSVDLIELPPQDSIPSWVRFGQDLQTIKCVTPVSYWIVNLHPLMHSLHELSVSNSCTDVPCK